jgi:signal transduction histidine kinase
VRIEVRDTGKGIAKDELPLIWNRYYRTKETHKRAIIGSGLGLNIVQSILKEHNVPYGVSSELDKGTTFWFELPLAKSHISDENPR